MSVFHSFLAQSSEILARTSELITFLINVDNKSREIKESNVLIIFQI